jgi:hypothetical protein
MTPTAEPLEGLRIPIVGSPEAPYRGIDPFRVVDAPIFFERAPEAERLFRMITIYRGVLLYGESGAGKSSLVNAGFIPRCLAEGMVPERLRVQPRPGAEIVLERISAGGDGAPFLPSLLSGGEDAGAREVLSAADLAQRVRALSDAAAADESGWMDEGGGPPLPVLVFDQFEEFVTLFQEAPPAEARTARGNVMEALAELLRRERLAVKLVFVFREDYLARLATVFARSPNLTDQFLRLAPLPSSAVHDVVRGPFEKVKGLFERELSPELGSLLEQAIAARSERGVLNLSEVQIACLRLWESDDPDALFREAGIEGLLSGYLEDALETLPPALRDPAILVLTRLVTGAGTRNVVSEDDLTEARHEEDPPPQELKQAVEALERTALLRREVRHNIYFYEISSEFLVPWIRRKRVERTARLERAAIEARETRKRRRAYTASAVVALLILAAALTHPLNLNREVLAVQRVREARATAIAATTAEKQAEDARDAAVEATDRARRAAVAAVAERTYALAHARAADETAARALQRADRAEASARTLLGERDAALGRFRQHDLTLRMVAVERDEAVTRAERAGESARYAIAERDAAVARAERAERAAEEAVTERDAARRQAAEARRDRTELVDSIAGLQRRLRAATASRDGLRDSTRILSNRLQQAPRDTTNR